MDKQCGSCAFWDRENAVLNNALLKAADCLAPVPDSCENKNKYFMIENEGQDCPVYNEIAAIEEDGDDPPDENGYTRADEDWFFDDKDD